MCCCRYFKLAFREMKGIASSYLLVSQSCPRPSVNERKRIAKNLKKNNSCQS